HRDGSVESGRRLKSRRPLPLDRRRGARRAQAGLRFSQHALGSRTASVLSIVAGLVVIAGFAGGAALSSSCLGVLSLWVAVVAGFAWLLGSSVHLYRTEPHPDADAHLG